MKYYYYIEVFHMDLTINIKTETYYIKIAKICGGKAASVPIPYHHIGDDVLCIPLLSPDMIIINEADDGEFIINCCGLEMLRKTVKANHGTKSSTGYVYIPQEYLTDHVLIVPL